jgi:hypothetical protein
VNVINPKEIDMNKTMQQEFENSLQDEWDFSTRPDGQYAFPSLREAYRAWLKANNLTDETLPHE